MKIKEKESKTVVQKEEKGGKKGRKVAGKECKQLSRPLSGRSFYGVFMPICSVDHAPCILCGHGRMNYGSGSSVAGPEQSITKGKWI